MSSQKRRRKRGTGSVVKRGNVYWFYHTLYGKLNGESLGTSSKQEADKLARQRLKEIQNEIVREKVLAENHTVRILPMSSITEYNPSLYAEYSNKNITEYINEKMANRPNSPTLDEIWKIGSKFAQDSGLYVDLLSRSEYSITTKQSYRSTYKKLRNLFPELVFMAEVTEEIAKTFEDICAEKGISKRTTSQYLLNLQAVWATTIKEGWYSGLNPFHPKPVSTKKQKMDKFLKHEEVDAILEAAKRLEDKTAYLFIAIAVHTGMRKAEVLNLMWEDIDFDNHIIQVQGKEADPKKGIQAFRPKSKQARAFRLKAKLAEILLEYKRDSGYVLKPDTHINRQQCNVPRLDKVIEATGIKFTPHLLRHTFASHAVMAGTSLYKVQRWLGHSDAHTTADVYAHLSPDDADMDKF